MPRFKKSDLTETLGDIRQEAGWLTEMEAVRSAGHALGLDLINECDRVSALLKAERLTPLARALGELLVSMVNLADQLHSERFGSVTDAHGKAMAKWERTRKAVERRTQKPREQKALREKTIRAIYEEKEREAPNLARKAIVAEIASKHKSERGWSRASIYRAIQARHDP